MKLTIQLLFIIDLLLVSPAMFGIASQESEDKPSLDRGSLDSQFDYVIKKSSPYLEFRVVEEAWLLKLKSHVSDSLKVVRKELEETYNLVSTKRNETDSILSVLQNTNDKLDIAIKEKNSLSFFGILMSKTAYNSLTWFIIAGLVALLVIFIILFKRSHIITAQTKTALLETKEEFEEHRTRARLRVEELVRTHHYELNKYKTKR